MSKWTPHATFWKDRGIPEPISEFKFHPTRRWRFDFIWDSAFKECEGVKSGTQVAVEVDGGIWIQGRHNRGYGMIKDNEKINEAQRLGWKVFKFSPSQMPLPETADFLRRILIPREDGQEWS